MLVMKINPINLQMDILIESLESVSEFYASLGINPENIEPLLNSFRELAKYFDNYTFYTAFSICYGCFFEL